MTRWLLAQLPSVVFVAVLLVGVLIIRRRRGRSATPIFALFLLLACVVSYVSSQLIAPSGGVP